MTETGTVKPVLRIIHLLARSGGTLISKCLGSMDSTVLLSEIHPHQINNMDAVQQAEHWFKVFDPEDEPFLRKHDNQEISFVDGVYRIVEKCAEKSKVLIIRDWNHIDFMGRPRIRELPMELSAAKLLETRFDLKRICIVRHPLDQWLSFRKSQTKLGIVTYDFLFKGYARFMELTKGFPFIRYEDFTKSPEKTMERMCDLLEIPYDSDFINKWGAYETITGDVYGDGRGKNNKIESFKRLSVEPEILKNISENRDYLNIIKAYGYDKPLPDPLLVKPEKLRRDKNRSEIISQYGEQLYLDDNKKTALRAFQAAVDVWPLNASAYNNSGVHHWQVGEERDALDFFLKAADLNPLNKDIVMNMAMAYAAFYRPDLAVHLLLDYLDVHGEDEDIKALYHEYKDRKMGQEY